MRVFIPRFLWAILYLLVLTILGVVGYVVLQGATIHDALYMTVITLTAVGYSEVLPLTMMGRNFTMVLLLGGITGMGLWFALITSFIVELDLKDVLRRRKTMMEIEKLKDHMVICGAGRTGRRRSWRSCCPWDSPSWALSMTPKGWRWSTSIIPTS